MARYTPKRKSKTAKKKKNSTLQEQQRVRRRAGLLALRGHTATATNKTTNLSSLPPSPSSEQKKNVKIEDVEDSTEKTTTRKKSASFDSQIAEHLSVQAESRLSNFASELRDLDDHQKTKTGARSEKALQTLQSVFQNAWKRENRIRTASEAASIEIQSGQSKALNEVHSLLSSCKSMLKSVDDEINSLKSQVEKETSAIIDELRTRLNAI